MTPFKRGHHNPPSQSQMIAQARENAAALGVPYEQMLDAVRSSQADITANEVPWLNDTYQVNVREVVAADGWPAMLHLSIKRRDKDVLHDWRDLQEIKNLIVGPEHEAVELYPAESRLVDSANQYHLWVLADAGTRFPFGFDAGRFVKTSTDTTATGSRQRERA